MASDGLFYDHELSRRVDYTPPYPIPQGAVGHEILTRECGWRLVSVEVAAAAEESEESVVKALAQEKKVLHIDTLTEPCSGLVA